MNRSYRTVWNSALDAWTAVPETVRLRGKGCGGIVLCATAAIWSAGQGLPAFAACVNDGATPPVITCTGATTGDQVIPADNTVINLPAGASLTAAQGFVIAGSSLSGVQFHLDGQLNGGGFNVSFFSPQSVNNSTLTLGAGAVFNFGPPATGQPNFDGNNNIFIFSPGSVINTLSTAGEFSIGGNDNNVTFAGSMFSPGGTGHLRLGGFSGRLRNLQFTFTDTGRIGNADFSGTSTTGISFEGNPLDPSQADNITAVFGSGSIYATTRGSVVVTTVADSNFTFNGTTLSALPGRAVEVDSARTTYQFNSAILNGLLGAVSIAGNGNALTFNQSTVSTFNSSINSFDFLTSPNEANTLTAADSTFSGSIAGGNGDETILLSNTMLSGTLALGAGNDSATLRSMTPAQMAALGAIDGGAGNDTLTLEGSNYNGGPAITNWETLNLVRGARLAVNGTLTMGTGGPAPGRVNVSSGAMLGGSGTVAGSVSIADGVLAPGNSPGTLTAWTACANASPHPVPRAATVASTHGENEWRFREMHCACGRRFRASSAATGRNANFSRQAADAEWSGLRIKSSWNLLTSINITRNQSTLISKNHNNPQGQ